MAHMGKIIVLEGLDKSGKTTQARLLHDHLNDKHKDQTELLSFPDYSTKIGGEIRCFLDGKAQYNSETKHMLLAANRWEKKENILESIKLGKTIILNRYYQSNLAYGLANGLDFEWLSILDRGMPKEDVTIILDINPQISYLRSTENNFVLDEFEKSREFLEKVRINYLELAKVFNWNVLHSENSKDIVFKSILKIIGEQ
jgi:dTMP kinase